MAKKMIKSNWTWASILLLAISIRCTSDIQKCPDKIESIDFTYDKDSIIISFSVDSSTEEMHDVIIWGYLNRVGYKNDDSEIYFTFYSKDIPHDFQIPDSTIIKNIKTRYNIIGNEIKSIKVERNFKVQLYGFLIEVQRSKDRLSIFSGEFTESHLPFSIEVIQNNINKSNPDILDCMVESLRIKVVPINE